MGGACYHISTVKCPNCMTEREKAERKTVFYPGVTTTPTLPNFHSIHFRLWHIRVEREISDDNFDIHMRSPGEPTDAQILGELAVKHHWEPNGEEYRFHIEEVTV